jgi:transcriptional regulator with XRE-family HTH domain
MGRLIALHVDDPAAVGRRLRSARLRAGLTQRALAFPGCSPAYVSLVESGSRIPSLQLLRELAARLGVSEDYLATGRVTSADLRELPHESTRLVDAEIALRVDDTALARGLYEHVARRPHGRHDELDAAVGLARIAVREDRLEDARALFEAALENAEREQRRRAVRLRWRAGRPSPSENRPDAPGAGPEVGLAARIAQASGARVEPGRAESAGAVYVLLAEAYARVGKRSIANALLRAGLELLDGAAR